MATAQTAQTALGSNGRNAISMCITGKIIFALTSIISIGYLILGLLYVIFDIKSVNTKQTVTSGMFGAFITMLWMALCVYANRLGRRILKSTTFSGSLRLHSKTVFKVPAILMLFVMGLATILIEAYRSYTFIWSMKACDIISIDGSVCRVFFIFKSIHMTLTLLFNICIAGAVLSICRTHTIGVRRFIRALEKDGHACELKHRQRFMKMQFAASHNLSEMYLPEGCYKEESDADSIDGEDDEHSLITYVPNSETAPTSTVNQDGPSSPTSNSSDSTQMSRMRMTSRVIQRWTSSWITFTILWLVSLIISWLNHPATYLEIAMFVLPLLMSIILCTAYGETNGEADKIISSITPLQDRLTVIRTLPCVQIGMTIYNHPLIYTNILGVVAAVGLALSSRMILDVFLPPSPHS